MGRSSSYSYDKTNLMTASVQSLMPAGVLGERQSGLSSPQSGNQHSNLLPFGNTLHYAGCGCPAWEKGSRVADQVDALISRSHQLFRNKLISPNRSLRVCYMLPHHNITGGMKCLVEHVRLLRQRGHYTIAVHRSDTAKRAMPPWTTVEADADVVCNLHQRLSDVYPIQDIDVVVVGIFHQVAELLAGVHAPVLYWEQGHEWIFGDPIRLQVAQNYLKQDQLFHLVMHLPCVLAAVSSAVQDILQQEFGRTSLLIPNGIDCDRFTPGAWRPTATVAAAATAIKEETGATAAASSGDAEWTDAYSQLQETAEAVAGMQVEAETTAEVDGMVTGSGEAAGTAVAKALPAAAAVLAAAPAGKVGVLAEEQQQQQGTAAVTTKDTTPAESASVDLLPSDLEQQQQQQQVLEPKAFDAATLSRQLDGSCTAPSAPSIDFAVGNSSSILTAAVRPDGKHRILIVGNPALPLKGFPTALAALAAVAAMLPIRVRWVCQVLPTAMTVPNLPLVDFELETVVSPSQAELPALYRGHDVFLFTSRYEAWGMPVLEAMASGVPVVTTDCLGVRTFCRHGENCLVAAADDATGVAQQLLAVLTDSALQTKLATAGRETALQYTPDKVMEHLEAVLYCLTACGPELLQLRQSCIVDLRIACAKASEACSRPSSAAQQQQQQQLALLQVQLKQQLKQQAAAEQRLQALLQQQQQLQLGLQLAPQQQQQGQQIRLQSLQVLQQLNLANPQQHVALLRKQQQQAPLQASLLMPFLQAHQPSLQQQSLQPSLQLQVRSSAAQQGQHQSDYSSMNAAMIGDMLQLTSQQQLQQHTERRSMLGIPLLQQQTSPAATHQQLEAIQCPVQQQQPQNAAALQVLHQLQQEQQNQQGRQQQQQQQHAALLSALQGTSNSLRQLPASSLIQQQVPVSLFQQQQAQIPASLFQQQQQQQQMSMSIWQQHQQVPTLLLQHQQQNLPLLTGLLSGTSAATAGDGLSLQLLSQQLLVQGLPVGMSQQQQHVTLKRSQQLQQYSTQLALSHQLPLAFSQQLPLGLQPQQQQPEQSSLGYLQQMPAGLSQQLGIAQQQQQDVRPSQQLFLS